MKRFLIALLAMTVFSAGQCRADTPVAGYAQCKFSPGDATVTANLDFGWHTVPAGQRLRILYITGVGIFSRSGPVEILAQFGTRADSWLRADDEGAFGTQERYTISRNVLAFGLIPFVYPPITCSRGNTNGSGIFAVTVTGYLEPNQPPMRRLRQRLDAQHP